MGGGAQPGGDVVQGDAQCSVRVVEAGRFQRPVLGHEPQRGLDLEQSPMLESEPRRDEMSGPGPEQKQGWSQKQEPVPKQGPGQESVRVQEQMQGLGEEQEQEQKPGYGPEFQQGQGQVQGPEEAQALGGIGKAAPTKRSPVGRC